MTPWGEGFVVGVAVGGGGLIVLLFIATVIVNAWLDASEAEE